MEPAGDMSSSDGVLAFDWRRGNRDAGNELVRMCRPALTAFFRRRAARDIDELVQVTLIACLEAVHHFEGRFRMEHRSSRSRESKDRLYASSDMGPSARERELPDPNELFARSEESRIVALAMNDTPSPFREVIEMFYWDDLSVEQIAATLRIPVGTVKSRLARGRSIVAARIRLILRAARPDPSHH